MENVPQQVLEQIAAAMCRPVGTVAFEFTSKGAFKVDGEPGVLFEVPTGGHLFRIERQPDRALAFIHAAPATGTRQAVIRLYGLPDFEQAFLAFSWSPEEVKFHCGPRIPNTNMLSSVGERSQRRFRVTDHGEVVQMGGVGIETMGLHIYRSGKPILRPAAIEVWQETGVALAALWDSLPNDNQLREAVMSCMALTAVVTAWEVYARYRFLEIESEGVAPDVGSLLDEFTSEREKDSGVVEQIVAVATEQRLSVARVLVEQRRSIDFQSYERLKDAYRAGYGVKLGKIGILSSVLEDMQRYIRYRHRIIHVSHMQPILNLPDVPPEKPDFANREMVTRAYSTFDTAIAALHAATTALRPKDK